MLFRNSQRSSKATCGVGGGFVGRAQRAHGSGREGKCSVVVQHEHLLMITGHLFLSGSEARAFSLRDRLISKSKLVMWVRGDDIKSSWDQPDDMLVSFSLGLFSSSLSH